MQRSNSAALIVAVLLVFAGCLGTNNPTDTTTTVPDTTTSTLTESIGTTTTTAPVTLARDSTPEQNTALNSTAEANISRVIEQMEFLTNYSAGGDLNATRVLTRHIRALSARERVTIRKSLQSGDLQDPSRQTIVLKETETREYYRLNASGMEMGRYTEGNDSYVKTVWNNNTSYIRTRTPDKTSRQRSNFTIMLHTVDFNGLWLAPYEKVGTVTRNGTPLTTYEATGPGYYATSIGTNTTIETFSATVSIDRNGLIRYYHERLVYETNGTRMIQERTIRYTDVGTTELHRPDWVDEVTTTDDERDS